MVGNSWVKVLQTSTLSYPDLFGVPKELGETAGAKEALSAAVEGEG